MNAEIMAIDERYAPWNGLCVCRLCRCVYVPDGYKVPPK